MPRRSWPPRRQWPWPRGIYTRSISLPSRVGGHLARNRPLILSRVHPKRRACHLPEGIRREADRRGADHRRLGDRCWAVGLLQLTRGGFLPAHKGRFDTHPRPRTGISSIACAELREPSSLRPGCWSQRVRQDLRSSISAEPSTPSSSPYGGPMRAPDVACD